MNSETAPIVTVVAATKSTWSKPRSNKTKQSKSKSHMVVDGGAGKTKSLHMKIVLNSDTKAAELQRRREHDRVKREKRRVTAFQKESTTTAVVPTPLPPVLTLPKPKQRDVKTTQRSTPIVKLKRPVAQTRRKTIVGLLSSTAKTVATVSKATKQSTIAHVAKRRMVSTSDSDSTSGSSGVTSKRVRLSDPSTETDSSDTDVNVDSSDDSDIVDALTTAVLNQPSVTVAPITTVDRSPPTLESEQPITFYSTLDIPDENDPTITDQTLFDLVEKVLATPPRHDSTNGIDPVGTSWLVTSPALIPSLPPPIASPITQHPYTINISELDNLYDQTAGLASTMAIIFEGSTMKNRGHDDTVAAFYANIRSEMVAPITPLRRQCALTKFSSDTTVATVIDHIKDRNTTTTTDIVSPYVVVPYFVPLTAHRPYRSDDDVDLVTATDRSTANILTVLRQVIDAGMLTGGDGGSIIIDDSDTRVHDVNRAVVSTLLSQVAEVYRAVAVLRSMDEARLMFVDLLPGGAVTCVTTPARDCVDMYTRLAVDLTQTIMFVVKVQLQQSISIGAPMIASHVMRLERDYQACATALVRVRFVAIRFYIENKTLNSYI